MPFVILRVPLPSVCVRAALQQLHGGADTQVSSAPSSAQMKSPVHAISTMPESVENVESCNSVLNTAVRVALTSAAVSVCRTAVLPLELYLPRFPLLLIAQTPVERSVRDGYRSAHETRAWAPSADAMTAHLPTTSRPCVRLHRAVETRRDVDSSC